ncbi:uncharacterized protein MELLADRAFT_113065 [Melampsora larici-populina 98AG31]|uniref:DUF6589 domain-containing protein n=1 Tax=Melampsora larici-populina (strain 98AG31 / pathotype 3-4-7) TaxID=747676 RepID=F4S8H4_MELLP|nr:uncharacterized protein MELLADRAFT_113065 [Melampsora larici-populina 98AG31]EGF99021.1 hypothetical protein MELLADRAFT_113065 [Melampsora larici-populina 98AG31]
MALVQSSHSGWIETPKGETAVHQEPQDLARIKDTSERRCNNIYTWPPAHAGSPFETYHAAFNVSLLRRMDTQSYSQVIWTNIRTEALVISAYTTWTCDTSFLQGDHSHLMPSMATSVPSTVSRTLLICEYMNTLNGFTPREFMWTFLSSTHPDLIYRRRLMKTGLGTRQTRSIFKNLGKLTSSCPQGAADWEQLILEDASENVNAQDVPRGEFPSGPYVSSKKITPDYFTEAAEAHRESQIRTGMNFLHQLIHRKLASGMRVKDIHHDPGEDEDPSEDPSQPGSMTHEGQPEGSTIEGALDEAKVLSLENMVYVKPTAADLETHKLATIPVMVCSMIAMACNRRANAIPLANGIITLAAGVTCRTNEWLYALGLTTSRWTILQALEHLRVVQEHRMMEIFKINHKLLPLLCYENVDIHLRIHNTRIETSSWLLHGTWGFFKVIEACVLAKCPEEVVNLASFLDSMASAQKKPVLMSAFAPKPDELAHWVSVIKSQLASALKEYVEHLPGAPARSGLPPLVCQPPAIDPIALHKPNIHFLRMVDAPDSSAEGVGRVFDAIKSQIGVSSEDLAEKLLIAGGDVGSNMLLESLRVKQYPPIDHIEGLESILSVFGGAHTTWNIAKNLWALHWGRTDKGEDSGVWRTSFALGGDYKKPVALQDFNSIMREMRIVHKANLIFIIKSVRIRACNLPNKKLCLLTYERQASLPRDAAVRRRH